MRILALYLLYLIKLTVFMKKQFLFALSAFFGISVLLLSSCTPDPVEYDETGYTGTYTGYHRLVDSANLTHLLGDIDYSFLDTLVVTNGTSNTDGKIYAKSSYLGGNIIEIDISKTSSNITPKMIGTLNIESTVLTDAKIGSGSTATWNATKDIANVKINAGATYGVIVLPPSIRLWGDFTKI